MQPSSSSATPPLPLAAIDLPSAPNAATMQLTASHGPSWWIGAIVCAVGLSLLLTAAVIHVRHRRRREKSAMQVSLENIADTGGWELGTKTMDLRFPSLAGKSSNPT